MDSISLLRILTFFGIDSLFNRLVQIMQKALFVTEVGKPVSLGTRAIPNPNLGEVLIKITSSQSRFLMVATI